MSSVVLVPQNVIHSLEIIETFIYCPDVVTALAVSNALHDDFRVTDDWYRSVSTPLVDQHIVDRVKRNVGQKVIPVVWENSKRLIRNADIAYNTNNRIYANLVGNNSTFQDAVRSLDAQERGYVLLIMVPHAIRSQLY